MSAEHTQQQSSEDQRRAKELSLKSTAPPIEVPGYETRTFLGSGAFGEVWVGVDQTTGRRVAIKFYTHRGGVDWTLLSREVEKLAVLSADRYVVQLLDVGWDSDPPYYVMDYIENGSLEDLLVREGPRPLREAVEIFEEVAVGLMHLHGKGVLHCDLKPANVLLDEDRKPRLADFGQSRLSHEQSPALGTLFYMAPEQADLEAVPDARWDVYALGALLYCMLTGAPPFRSGELIEQIESATDLPDRLRRYRQAIETAPRPAGHRQTAGIDRALVEIIDRCLIVNPRDRFPSIQSVLEALRERAAARVRNPLLLLGVAAPILFLIIMVYFGLTNYQVSLEKADEAVIIRVRKSNQMFAESVARAIQAEIERYFTAVEYEAKRAELRQQFEQILVDDATQQMLGQLKVPYSRADEMSEVREQFETNAIRQQLKNYLQERLDARLSQLQEDKQALKFASIFVLDQHGTIVAVAYDDPSTTSKSVGRNYAYRTYFHDEPNELSESQSPLEITPISKTHLSSAFRSTSTKTWKVAVSTPILMDDRFRGVLVLTIELGDFTPFRNHADDSAPDHFAVLVDSRPGAGEGTILHHPFFIQRPGNQPTPLGQENGEDYTHPRFHVDLKQFERVNPGQPFIYQDPLGKATGGEAYQGKWIAAMSRVLLPGEGSTHASRRDSRLAVVVQESYEETVRPLQSLGQTVLVRATLALIGFVLVVCVEWYFVVRMLGGLGPSLSKHLDDRPTTRSLHSMDTLAAPRRPES